MNSNRFLDALPLILICCVVAGFAGLLGWTSIDASTTSQPGPQTYDDTVTLQSSGAATATGNGTVNALIPGGINGVILTLDVTAAATAVGDTLDVYVQTKLDGVNWTDVAHFTSVLGNGGAKRYVDKIHAHGDVALFETGAALAESAQRDLIGTAWRVRWVIVDADTDDASFTFSVVATPM